MSSLIDYQRALAAAVRGDAPQTTLPPGLSAPGIAMTGRVRASWCIGRARRAAPLTLSALNEPDREAILRNWVTSGGGISSFFEAETEVFLAFIAGRLETPSHAASLCAFERAIIRARAAASEGLRPETAQRSDIVRRSSHADLVLLHAPIDRLLDAMAGKGPWPGIAEASHSLLIAPGIAGLVRDASSVEIALWQAAGSPLNAADHWPAARALVACGALVVASGG